MREKLSWREAEAVVRAFRVEHGMSSEVEIDVLAATLGTTPAEVRRLATPKRRLVDRSGILSAVLALGIAGTLAFFRLSPIGISAVRGTSRIHAVPMPTKSLVVIDLNTGRELPLYPAHEPHAVTIKTL